MVREATKNLMVTSEIQRSYMEIGKTCTTITAKPSYSVSDDPIHFLWTKSSHALYFFLVKKVFSLRFTSQHRQKDNRNVCFMLTLIF